MIQFVEAINPWNSCFTTSDFEDALIDIDVILTRISEASKDHKKPLSYQEKISLLENAYSLAFVCLKASHKYPPDKSLSILLTEILRQYASLNFKNNYFSTKQLLLVALNLHLYTIGIFSECIDLRDFITLDDLKKQSEAKPALFYCMEDSILSTSIDRCMTLAYTDNFMRYPSNSRLFRLAETVRYLGYCYQKLDSYLSPTHDNDLRFSQLFKLSEGLHLFINSPESKLALGDLYFQSWPFMYARNCPNDVEGICKLYEKALDYDSSPEMQALIADRQFQVLFSHGKKQESVAFLQKAVLQAETLDDNDDNRRLLSGLYHSLACYHMDPESLDLNQAEINLSKASKYASLKRSEGVDLLEFAHLDMQYAELKFVKEDFNAAKDLVERALTTLKKQPQSYSSLNLQAEALKNLIERTHK
jgi:tetratricopeptide (TPR) repeat protein